MNTVTFEFGANQLSSTYYVGKTIRDAIADPLLRDQIGISGDESYQVSSDDCDCDDMRSVEGDYVLQAGDEVVFSRRAGQKG
jgi:hypothetical protein